MAQKNSRSQYIMNWERENYDRILLRLPKGYKDKLKAHIGKESMNAYLKRLIDEDMQG